MIGCIAEARDDHSCASKSAVARHSRLVCQFKSAPRRTASCARVVKPITKISAHSLLAREHTLKGRSGFDGDTKRDTIWRFGRNIVLQRLDSTCGHAQFARHVGFHRVRQPLHACGEHGCRHQHAHAGPRAHHGQIWAMLVRN